jgi:NADH-quinone oxidoreductase subunit C
MPADEKGGTPEVEPAAVPAPELSPLLAKVMDRLSDAVLEHHTFRGDDRIHIAPERLLEVAKFLRDDPALAFDFLVDVTAVDYLGQPDDFETKLTVWDENRAVVRRRPQRRHELVLPPPGPQPRFAVVYHLASTSLFHRLRIKCRVTEEDPSIPSLTPLWSSADWMERETYDMYGIKFIEHPDLRRIYLYEEFVGHPLRKDYHKHHEQPIQPYVGPGAKEPRRPN